MKNRFNIAAVTLLAIGVPAAAQSPQGGDPNQSGHYQGQNHNQNGNYQNHSQGNYQNRGHANFPQRIAQLQARLQSGIQSGAISRQEARPLRLQLRQLVRLERQYSRDGLNRQERTDLQQRIRDLRQRLRTADGGAQGRYDQWGKWDREDGYGDDRYRGNDRYDRDDRPADRIDRNNDGFDDRDSDRDGRWDDNVDDGRYQQQPQQGGLGGLLGSLLGGGGLRVGQQAPSNLYGVPERYRDQYRDGNSAYYRSDGRSIYEIDARNRTVVRIFPMDQ